MPRHATTLMPNDLFDRHADRASPRDDADDCSEADEHAIDCSDDELGDSEDGEEDFDDEDPAVMCLRCKRCDASLSERGMEVHLVADIMSTLYSTDIPSDAVTDTGLAKPIPTCECTACCVACRQCGSVCGYHVVKPCDVCLTQGNNGHYWLFNQADVVAIERGCAWSALPYNGASPVDEIASAAPSSEICCICAASPLWRPTRVRGCNHRFCFGCISREVDARGACPLDRRPCTRDSLIVLDLESPPLEP